MHTNIHAHRDTHAHTDTYTSTRTHAYTGRQAGRQAAETEPWQNSTVADLSLLSARLEKGVQVKERPPLVFAEFTECQKNTWIATCLSLSRSLSLACLLACAAFGLEG